MLEHIKESTSELSLQSDQRLQSGGRHLTPFFRLGQRNAIRPFRLEPGPALTQQPCRSLLEVMAWVTINVERANQHTPQTLLHLYQRKSVSFDFVYKSTSSSRTRNIQCNPF